MSFLVDGTTVFAADASEYSSSSGLIEKTGQWTIVEHNTPVVTTGPRAGLFARRLNGVNTDFTVTVTSSSSSNPTRDVIQNSCTYEACINSRSHATSPSTRRTIFLAGYNDAALIWLLFSPSGGFELLFTPSLGGVNTVVALTGPTLTQDAWTYIALRKTVTSGSTPSNRLNTYELFVRPLSALFGSDTADSVVTGVAQSGLQSTVHFDFGNNVGGPSANAPSYYGLHDMGPCRFSSGARSLADLQESFARLLPVTIAPVSTATLENRWLATNVVRNLKLRGLLPTAESTFSLDDFLFLLDDGLLSYVVPILRESNQEDYLTQALDIPVVSGTARYPIPARAASEQLVLVELSDGQGGFAPLSSIRRIDANRYSGGAAWYVDDDALVLVPTPTAGSTLRVHYPALPGRLVDEAACGQIASLDTGAKSVTLASVPVDATGSGTSPTTVAFTTSWAYDFVRGTPGFRCLAIDATCNTLVGNTMTFDDALPAGLAVGDYVCIAQQSPIPQVPQGVHPLLAAWAGYTCELALGNPARIAAASAEMTRQEKFARSLISQQRGDSPAPIQNFNAPGWARYRRRMR